MKCIYVVLVSIFVCPVSLDAQRLAGEFTITNITS
jgi:hypothetical protein